MNEHFFITHILASGVACGLRRLPAGFHVIVEVDGNITQTSNVPIMVGEDSVEWDQQILLPSNPSSCISFSVYASFELGPRLGNGELICQFEITVREVLDLNEPLQPIDFVVQKDVILPSRSSLEIITERRICEMNESCPELHVSQPNEMERLTDEGHRALLRYHQLQNQIDLDAAVKTFEHVQENSPTDHPHHSTVLFNLANAKFIDCQANGLDLDVPIRLYRDTLRFRGDDHPDHCTTALELSFALLSRFQRRGDLMDREEASDLLMGVVEVSAAESHSYRAGRFGLQIAKFSVSIQAAGAICSQAEEVDLDVSIQRSQDRLHNLSSRNPRRSTLLASLGMLLCDRFEQNRDLIDINEAILMLENAVDLTPRSNPNIPDLLTNLGDSLLSRFDLIGDLDNINRSIAIFDEAVDLTPDGDPDKPARFSRLGISLLRRFQRLGMIADINRSILTVDKAVCLTPDSDPDKPIRLNNLGNSLSRRFESLGDPADINRSISIAEDAVRLTHNGHPSKPGRLSNLGNSLLNRFERLGDLSDINRSISLFEEAVSVTPNSHPVKLIVLMNLGNSLFRRFERLGNLSDINRSISMFEEVLPLISHAHPKKPELLIKLGSSLSCRFERLGDLADIDRSISMTENAIYLTPDGHPNEPAQLNNLGNSLLSRFERIGDLADINRSISTIEDAVRLTPKGHPSKPARLSNLGNSLFRRFQHLENLTDINRSISLLEESVSLTPDAHPVKPAQLNNLGNSLSRRFDYLGNLSDISRSISMFEEAIHLTPKGHPVQPARLNNLGDSLTRRFDRLGDLADINKSILSQEEAVHLTSNGHPNKPTRLINLGNSLFRRFEHLGDPADINASISRKEEAINLMPDGHPDKPACSSSLGSSLLARFEYFGNLSDISRSILIFEEANGLTPNDHPYKPAQLIILGGSLYRRFGRLGDLADIDRSILIIEKAVGLTPDGHPIKPVRLNNLARSLLGRFDSFRNLADIVRSIAVNEEALGFIPDGHPNKPGVSRSLGEAFMSRFQHFHDSSDLSATAFHFEAASRASIGPAYTRFHAARGWISSVHLQGNPPALLDAYGTAIDLLPQLAWIGLPVAHRHRLLIEAADVTRDAAAAALEAGYPDLAVEQLEQGRSIVWTQILQLRDPVDELRVNYPILADQFQHVSRELEQSSRNHSVFQHLADNSTTHTRSLEDEVQKHHDLAMRRDKLLIEIRLLPGFDRFLLPKTIKELASLANSGTVIYLNASKHRCDALIVTAGLGKAVPVSLADISYQDVVLMQCLLLKRDSPIVSRDEILTLMHSEDALMSQNCLDVFFKDCIEGYNREGALRIEGYSSEDRLRWILAFLWKRVLRPVLDAIDFSTPPSMTEKMAHVFWCPTGPFSFLPIHAAGLYGAAQTGEKLSDFVISSYIPTLSALARRAAPSAQNVSNDASSTIRLLLIPQPPEDGQIRLPCVGEEIDCIKSLSAKYGPVTMQDSNGVVEDVTEKMVNADWVHFACHGVQDLNNPLNSGLCLANHHRLTLSDIIRLSRPQRGLAFLSACQTARGDEKLSEESVHLAAGMLLAGYNSVIATMWSIMDHDAPKVTKYVYEHLFRRDRVEVPETTEAAEALHRAVQRLRESGVPFSSWVPFIHVGW